MASIRPGRIDVRITGHDYEAFPLWSTEVFQRIMDEVLERRKVEIFERRRQPTGTPYPEGVTLIDTGAFKRSLRAVAVNDKEGAIFSEGLRYPVFLDRSYGWADLSKKEERLLDRTVIDAIDGSVRSIG